MVDLILAIAHHLLVFSLVAVLATEIIMVRPDIRAREIRRLGKVDIMYGAIAGLIIVVGVLRVIFGVKGASYYLASPSFWAKMGAFVLVGLLSIPPTLRIGGWRRAAAQSADFSPPRAEIQSVRRMMHTEAVIFLLIPVFAAAMARGY